MLNLYHWRINNYGLVIFLRILLIFLLITLGSSCSYTYDFSVSETSYRSDKTNTWSTNRVVSGDEIFWVKRELTIEENLAPFEPLGLHTNYFGDYLVYWDDVLIGRNGFPGQETVNARSSEVDRNFLVPDSLATIGTHEVKLKVSRQLGSGSDRSLNLMLAPYNELLQLPLKHSAIAGLLAGAFLIGSIYFFVLYLSDRKEYESLLFSTGSFLFFLLILLEYIKFYIPIHYTFFNLRLEIISLFIFLISAVIPLFLALQYQLPKRKFFLGAYLLILIVLYIIPFSSYDFTARLFASVMWSFSVLITFFGIFRKETGAKVVFLGLVLAALVDLFLVFDLSLFLGFLFILLAMFYTLLIQMKERRQAYETSLVKSERLRNELLKKNIQPHFLLNTLTSLIDWIEESPKKGVKMIEALAEEFRLLNDIEEETLISLRSEIDLCRSHLEVMRFRKEIDYKWEEEVQNDEVKIPPAILHTLLENGITHCQPGKENLLMFRLECRASPDEILLKFRTLGKIRNKNKTPVDGTGIKYIKSRLTESFGSSWTFSSEATKLGWENNIRIWDYARINS